MNYICITERAKTTHPERSDHKLKIQREFTLTSNSPVTRCVEASLLVGALCSCCLSDGAVVAMAIEGLLSCGY